MMTEPESFEAVIEAGQGGGAFVTLPEGFADRFGGRKRVKVRATFDDVEYRGTLAWMGGLPVIGVIKDIRSRLGKDVGDLLHVTVEEDRQQRIVDVPRDLAERLRRSPAARTFFESLSYTARKEYARWITEAKRDDTRQRRLHEAIAKLERGEKR